MKCLLATENPRDTFVESFINILENDEFSAELLKVKCNMGHQHIAYLRRTAFTSFNISGKNYASDLNEKTRKSKELKRNANKSKAARKIKKLQSE